jgi:hypothetical protein
MPPPEPMPRSRLPLTPGLSDCLSGLGRWVLLADAEEHPADDQGVTVIVGRVGDQT